MSRSSELINILEPMWEMANLDSEDTGIPSVVIYVSEKNHSSGPRIKVAKRRMELKSHRDSFSVSISDNPTIVSGSPKKIASSYTVTRIIDWVSLNKDVLLDYWNRNIPTRVLFQRIKPLS